MHLICKWCNFDSGVRVLVNENNLTLIDELSVGNRTYRTLKPVFFFLKYFSLYNCIFFWQTSLVPPKLPPDCLQQFLFVAPMARHGHPRCRRRWSCRQAPTCGRLGRELPEPGLPQRPMLPQAEPQLGSNSWIWKMISNRFSIVKNKQSQVGQSFPIDFIFSSWPQK